MYDGSNFTSDLVNSYAWDTAILFIQNCGTNSKYSIQISLNESLLQTGTTTDKQCNIYDMASNARELTTETFSRTNYPCVTRGGYSGNSTDYTSHRYGIKTSDNHDRIGFRPILYINL